MIDEWVDKNGLLKPQKHWVDSGNGVLYTSIYLLVTGLGPGFFEYDRLKKSIDACNKNGLLLRTPSNEYGQEQWDNYLGHAALCAVKKLHGEARRVLWYSLTHLGFHDTDGKREGKDWLWRFPQVFILYWIAAFPFLKWPLYPFFALIASQMKPSPTDASGTQLAWVYHFTGRCLYGHKFENRYLPIAAQYAVTSREYYSPGHPIPAAFGARHAREGLEGWKCIQPT